MKNAVLKGMVAGLALVAATPALAGEGSANVALTSNYIFRGITQTQDGAALQAGYDYDFKNGFAVGVWGSNVNFGTSEVEYDLYGSYSGEAGDLGYSLSYFTYNYTTSATASEPALGLSYKDAKFSYYMGDGYNYMELGYSTEVSGVGLGLTYGSNSITGGASDSNYSLGASKDFSGYTVGLTYANYAPVVGAATTSYALSVKKSF